MLITEQIGVGGVIVILTKGMGEWLTHGILARYHVVLVEHLGGLFFDGRCSCTVPASQILHVHEFEQGFGLMHCAVYFTELKNHLGN